MVDILKTASIGLLLLAAAVAAPAEAAPTNSIFHFSGACADCYGGNGNATASLVLQDYSLGQEIDTSNFVSFTYDGTDLITGFTVTATSPILLFGSIDGPLPDTEDFGFYGPNFLAFATFKEGTWCVGYACSADYGDHHLWSSVSNAPEPASWAMMIAGFGAVGTALRRRRVTVRFA